MSGTSRIASPDTGEHLGLVGYVLRRLRSRVSVQRLGDDARGVGLLALTEATSEYDPDRGQFVPFALFRIEKAILAEAAKRREESVCPERLARMLPDREQFDQGGASAQLPEQGAPPALAAFFERLTPAERDIVARRLGLGVPALSLRALARVYGVDPKTVAVWHERALDKLRLAVESDG